MKISDHSYEIGYAAHCPPKQKCFCCGKSVAFRSLCDHDNHGYYSDSLGGNPSTTFVNITKKQNKVVRICDSCMDMANTYRAARIEDIANGARRGNLIYCNLFFHLRGEEGDQDNP